MNKSNYRPASKTESSLDFKSHPLINEYRYIINDPIINGSINGSAKIKLVEIGTQTECDYTEYILNKLIMFMQHLFLITMFELIFFFNYVTKYEDGALLGVFNSLTGSIISKCNNLNNVSKICVFNGEIDTNSSIISTLLDKTYSLTFTIRNNLIMCPMLKIMLD